jgi:3-hydroxybutyryl-CoA dehydrogenase
MQIGVVGAGTMGNGIAQVFAAHGHAVVLSDVAEDAVRRGMDAIGKSLARIVKKGEMTEAQSREATDRIRPSTSLSDLRDCDLVVEAIVEKAEVKEAVFCDLDRIVKKEAILASNTSSIPITRIAAATARPDKVIGMHFMNPVPVMKLVEVIRSGKTSNDTTKCVMDLALSLGKTPVEVNDSPGFVSNRILLPMINEAIFCLHEKVATAEAIDTVMRLGMNHPIGPLALADLIGLDVCLAILEVLQRDLHDDKYRPCPLLREMVQAGRLGKKSRRGFHTY